jgi:hypothetical protein
VTAGRAETTVSLVSHAYDPVTPHFVARHAISEDRPANPTTSETADVLVPRFNIAAKTAARACSFSGATVVFMADGSRKPIENIEVGDRVVATDPETGERVARRVTRVWVHDDTVLDLVVEGEVITTTEDHPFWSVTDQRFERADELEVGEIVLGDRGRQLAVLGLRPGTERTTLAYNLSIFGVHTYHVGQTALLVHNACNPSRMAQEVARGRGPRGIERVDLPHRGVPGSQPHITFSDDLPTLNLDGTWGHLGRNGGRVPNITNRQRRWLESHEWPVPD